MFNSTISTTTAADAARNAAPDILWEPSRLAESSLEQEIAAHGHELVPLAANSGVAVLIDGHTRA